MYIHELSDEMRLLEYGAILKRTLDEIYELTQLYNKIII